MDMICSKCKTDKSQSNFYRDSKSKSGFSCHCKSCSDVTRKINREKSIDRDKEIKHLYYLSHKYEMRSSNEVWKLEHPDKMNVYKKKYVDNNKDKVRLAVRKSQAKHIERVKNYIKSWFSKNPLKRQEYSHRRRTRIINAGNSFTSSEWNDLLESCGNRCLKCGRTDVKLTVDHIVPVSMGGSNSIDNIQPLCGSCNSSKKDKTIDYRMHNEKSF